MICTLNENYKQTLFTLTLKYETMLQNISNISDSKKTPGTTF